jgi:hypothetical protein
MPRQARIDSPGALHHIIARGIERKYHLKSKGLNFEKVLGRVVAELLDLKPGQVLAVGKYKKTVVARSLLCF